MEGKRALLSAMILKSFFLLPFKIKVCALANEEFGVVYLEAMAHGEPVIACRGEGIEDVVSNRETGLLVEPKDLGSLVKALDFLISHPQEAQAIGEWAKELVLQEYTWEKSAQKIIKVYQEVLGYRVRDE